MELLNFKINELQKQINSLKATKDGLRNSQRKAEAKHQAHFKKHTCIPRRNKSKATYFNKAKSTRCRIKNDMAELLKKIDEHNVDLGKLNSI